MMLSSWYRRLFKWVWSSEVDDDDDDDDDEWGGSWGERP